MISSRKRTVLFLLVSFLIAPMNITHSETNQIELFSPEKSCECYQEISLVFGNIWTMCGPYRYKDKYMDKVRLVYIHYPGTGEPSTGNIVGIKDILSGKNIGYILPGNNETNGQRRYLSRWDRVKESAEETFKVIDK